MQLSGQNINAISPIFSLREKRRGEVISSLQDDVNRLREADPNLKFWLIGSYAVSNWDAYSDVDVVCVSNNKYFDVNFNTSNQYPMDVFSLTEEEFAKRLEGSYLFKKAINTGVIL